MEETFGKIGDFFKTKLGKLIIMLIILAIVVYFAIKGYEMIIYKGMTKKQLLKKLAEMRASQHIDWVSNNDTNYLAQTTEAGKEGIFQWYRDNLDWNTQLTDAWIKETLVSLGIDEKHAPSKAEIIPLIVI